MDTRPAKRNDWKTEPMSALQKSLPVEETYSFEEFNGISEGVIPEGMEDKWFIYYDSPWLYVHRSWNGYCIFRVRFEPGTGGMRIAEALVSRDPLQYSVSDDTLDAELLRILINSRAKRDVRKEMVEYIRRRQSKLETSL